MNGMNLASIFQLLEAVEPTAVELEYESGTTEIFSWPLKFRDLQPYHTVKGDTEYPIKISIRLKNDTWLNFETREIEWVQNNWVPTR